MSKKFSFIFSLLVFAILFSFIGCTDLLAPKAQTDINLNIDLSKIIKSSRNEGGSQGASSLGDNPTIKVAIYDAKDYDKATNSTENLTLITQAQASVGGDGIARVKLSDIPVGIDAIVFAELSFSNGNSTEVMYAGNSGVFKVKASDNKVSLVLMKVGNSEIYPDDTNSLYENYTLYKKTENGEEEEVSNNTEASISTSSTGETIVTVKNTYNSDSVWTYFVKPNNNTRFVDDGNYKVSVELKTKSDATTVVGIAAARADYFFTVNDTWTLCEFETGYVKGSTGHQFTIGLGLSSEIQIKNLKIEKLSEIDTSEPSLVFDISKDAIETYLGQADKATKIIDVEKVEDDSGMATAYNITINAPLSHSATVQDVKLHLRSYATENTGANRVSFVVNNPGANTFYTSVMADTASNKSTAWNNGTQQISNNNCATYEIDFPNYVQNDELNVDLITSSTSTSQDNSTSFTLSNFKVEKAGDSPFSGKIFAIKTGETWTQRKSVEVTIPAKNKKEFDVGMFNGWDSSNSMPSSFDDVTRFFYTGDTNIKDDLIYSVNNDNPNEPKFIITNDSNEEKTVKIKLNENYEVVIEEVSSIVTTWADLKYRIDNTSISEFVITGNLTATEEITISAPVKLIASENVTISRGANFPGKFFVVVDKGSLELGSNDYTITVDGGKDNNITATDPLIWAYSESESLTLTNCILQNNTLINTESGYGNGGAVKVESNFTMNNSFIKNCSANVNGGAVYIFSRGSFTMNGGSITECSANDGGAVYITGGGTFTMNDVATISDCTANLSGGGVWMDDGSSFTMSGDNSKIQGCTANSEGGGVYVTDVNNPCTFKILDNATITGCSAKKGGGGVSYGCGTSGTFEISENAKILNNKNNNSSYGGGGIYLYGKLTMNGGTISGNEASNGAGVYVRNDNNVLSSLSMSGNALVDSRNDVYLSNGTTVIVAGNLTKEEVAKITPYQYAVGTQILSADGVDLAQHVDKFTLSNEEFVIDSDGKIASAINYAQGITYDSTSNTLYISDEEGLITFRDIVNETLAAPVTIKDTSPSNNDISFDYTDYTDYTGYDNSARTLNAKLTNDITLTKDWTPIGHSSIYSYAGTFDGDGHTISNLNINETTSSDSTGFIGYSGYNSTGGIIQNLVISGTMNVNSAAAGGFVGTSAVGCTITNCVNQINITNTSEADYTGTAGFVGLLENNYEVNISNSINLGNITGTNNVAGFVGSFANLSSYNQSVYNIDKSINIGTIIVSKSAKTAAGFSAISASSSKSLTNLINMGTLGNYDVAGICYFFTGSTMTISNCINTGKSDISSGTYNAIIPLDNRPTSNCYFDNSINPYYTYGGTGKTTAELCGLSQNDLSNDWTFEADRYPLPNIGSSIPGGQEGDIWKAVIAAAKPEDISGGTGGGAIEANTTVSSWSVLKTTIESITGDYTKERPYIIAIENNMNTEDSTAAQITVSSHIKLVTSGNYTITRTTDFAAVNFFTVSQGASLALGDSSVSGTLTLDGGGSSVDTTNCLINISSGGTLILNQNSILQNNICKTGFATNGSAVYSSGGNIYINGGIIQNNSNSYKNNYGGGIYLKNGTFTMTSGTFDGNSTYRQGGALWLQGSTVEISGGTFINNTLTETETPTENYYGSAIYIASLNESSTIAGIEVKNNENAGYGAIYILSSSISFTSCNFISNSSYQRGGAIYTGSSSSNIEISNCTFENNTTVSDTGNGGAIYCNDGSLSISDSQFTDNSEYTIFKGTSATITIDGETITDSWNP